MIIGSKNRFSFAINGREIMVVRSPKAKPVKNCTRQEVYEAMADMYEYFTNNCLEIDTERMIPIEWIKERYGWLTMAHEIIKEWEKENAEGDIE